MKITTSAYTLLELLIVIGIISSIAAILYPVFASVRRDANKSVTFSNLRQCGLALTMYCDDYDGPRSMPSGEVAKVLLANAPTCDAADTWRSSCSEDYGAPLIGSYAYVNSIDINHFNLLEEMNTVDNPTIMAAIYYADPVPIPFVGDIPRTDTGLLAEVYPNEVVRLKLDGSVVAYRDQLPELTPPGSHWGMTWPMVFQR